MEEEPSGPRTGLQDTAPGAATPRAATKSAPSTGTTASLPHRVDAETEISCYDEEEQVLCVDWQGQEILLTEASAKKLLPTIRGIAEGSIALGEVGCQECGGEGGGWEEVGTREPRCQPAERYVVCGKCEGLGTEIGLLLRPPQVKLPYFGLRAKEPPLLFLRPSSDPDEPHPRLPLPGPPIENTDHLVSLAHELGAVRVEEGDGGLVI